MDLALGPSLVQRPRFILVAVRVALALLLQLPPVLVALLVGHLAREQHRVVALALLSAEPQLLSRLEDLHLLLPLLHLLLQQ